MDFVDKWWGMCCSCGGVRGGRAQKLPGDWIPWRLELLSASHAVCLCYSAGLCSPACPDAPYSPPSPLNQPQATPA